MVLVRLMHLFNLFKCFFASSLPLIFVCALPSRIVRLCWDILIVAFICVIGDLFGWLYWDEGCLT